MAVLKELLAKVEYECIRGNMEQEVEIEQLANLKRTLRILANNTYLLRLRPVFTKIYIS